MATATRSPRKGASSPPACIALIGVITAALASWLIERVRTVEQDAQAATRRDIAELSQRLEEVADALHQLAASRHLTDPAVDGPA